MSLVAAAQPIIVEIPSSEGGVSLESILVFAGGVLAAVAAVAAAFLTTRGANARLETSLASERDRAESQLAAERDRINKQLGHERHLAERAEASATVEQIARLVARSAAGVTSLAIKILRDGPIPEDKLREIELHVGEIREEINVVAIRFGNKSPIVPATAGILDVVKQTLNCAKVAPLSDQQKEELRTAVKQIGKANAKFLLAARQAIDDY